ncbi:ornithine cyclodeaminase family protein [Corynebacterium sp. Marseille-P4321]|uniref:ornithine cyclodeaminase family protein n=1 Tax=Corynebacterium sp. Marseille-P4321 TaxID=2736603 RepID=UPI001C37E64C|nr:ornithine cyclodeaminase family protein [Corynebacterium sp. Marseille-P4321]
MRFFDHDTIMRALTPAEAVDAIRAALKSGVDPSADAPRTKVPIPHGEMHLLPAAFGNWAGVKVLGLQPPGSELPVPLVQGSYLLFEGKTLTPHSLLDGTSLTTLRTPAVAVAAVRDVLTTSSGPLDVAVFGTGAQGVGHAATVANVLDGVRDVHVTFISRTPREGLPGEWAEAGSETAAEALGRAGLVITATTSPTPILQAADLQEDAVVLAVGSHTTDARELPADLLDGAQVIVEDVSAAMREAGDVVLAIADGVLEESDLIPMADVVTGRVTLD